VFTDYTPPPSRQRFRSLEKDADPECAELASDPMWLMCRRPCAHRLVFALLSMACGGVPRVAPGRDAVSVNRSAHSAAFRSSAGAELSLTLNLPAFRLEVYRGPELLRTYRVAIGMREYPPDSFD
jgi:hypothetical protein